MEEGLDKVLRGVPAKTNPGLEERSKSRLQEASKGIDNGGDWRTKTYKMEKKERLIHEK